MDPKSTLFDLDPYTQPKSNHARRNSLAIAPEVWSALARLKQTMDALPPAERERRRRAWVDSGRQ